MPTLQHYRAPVLQRLHRLTASLEDAETERDAAIVEALRAGCPVAEIADATCLTRASIDEIAEAWGYRTREYTGGS